MSKKTEWRRDIFLYALVGGLMEAQKFEWPEPVKRTIAIGFAVAVVMKAKMSNGKPPPGGGTNEVSLRNGADQRQASSGPNDGLPVDPHL